MRFVTYDSAPLPSSSADLLRMLLFGSCYYSRTPLIRPPSESHWCGRIRGMAAREGFVYEQKPLSVTRNVVVREGWSLVRVVVRQGFYCTDMLSAGCITTSLIVMYIQRTRVDKGCLVMLLQVHLYTIYFVCSYQHYSDRFRVTFSHLQDIALYPLPSLFCGTRPNACS